ncbi:hypothetical protein HO482_05665 [Streptococcus suis]|nr:hypothetical protein [Streptococcus suis]
MTKQQKRKKYLRHQQFKSAAVAAATVATIAFNHRSVQAAEEIQPTAVPEPEVRATSEAESPLESAETLEFIEESQPMAVSAPVADTNSEAETVETPVTTRTVPLTYTVRYVDRYTKEVVHSVIKTVTIETSDAVAKTVVTENGAELVNDSQLEWYYVPDGNPTNLSLTVIEGEENVLTYEVEGFGEKEVKERAVDISYRVDYIDSATQNVIYSETKTHTVQTKLSQASTTVTVVADALNTASQLETYSLPTNTANNKTVTITEGMENIFTFELESADTSKGRTTRKVDYSAGENAPYLTIENYTENAKGNDTQIYKTNGETVHLNYKIGYTRIAAEDLDLTEDAKKLGLTLNTDTGFISGDVLLDTSRLGAYKIGIQSKNAPKVTVAATLVVQSHIGFVLEDDDNVRGYSSEFVKPNPVMNFRKVNYAPGDVYGLPYNSVEELNVPLSELIYSMNLTTTPFGYYVDSKQTVAEATPTTEQYNVILPLVARYDTAREFQNNGMALTIAEFTQLEASEGVAVELMDLRTADLTGLVTTPSSTYATLTDYGRNPDVTNTTPYFVRFTSLPKTEGSYNVKFKIVDNLGLEKFMTINFKTVERSMSGAITHADVRFTGTKDFINPVTNTVQVPATTAEQVLGTVHLNKENAWIKEVKLPEGAKLVSTKLNDEGKPTEVQVVKEEGTKLKPGSYTIEVRAIDGHFADDAPNRLFTFLVTDAIKPIEHQVWREGTMPDPIPVSMESGSLISDIRIVNSENNAYLEANVTDSNISIYGLEETTETQKARVYVTYLNEDGTSTETFTDFTYVVLAEPDNDLRVSVTNAAQEVVEGTRWKDMVISHTEGANLLVDTSSLPKGTKYDEVTKTISGIGRYEGTYDISVVVEKDGVVKGTVVHLVVTPGVFEVPDETIEVTVLGKYDNLGLNELPDGARVIYDVSLDGQSAGFKTNESGTRITGNPTYVSAHTVNATVFKTASNGIVRSDTATLTIKVKGIPASLDISNDDQSIDVGTAIQDIQITKDPHSTLSVSTSSLPPGVTYNKETGIISGTPTQYGDYYISVSTEMPWNYAGDLDYNQRYIYKQIRLNVRKHTPTLTVSSEEQTFSAATDMTPVVLTNDERSRLEVTNLPDGVRYDPATKTISGRPSNGIGDYWINVSASMPSELGGDVIYKNIRLTVTSIASSLDATNDKQTVVAKQGIEAIQVIKDDYSIMSEPYVLIGYTQYSLSDVGLQYNSDTKTITGNPTIVGTYTIKLRTVLESKLGGGEANKDITLTVNQIPFTIDITNQEQTKVVLTEIAPVTVTVPDDTTISVNEWQLPPGIRYNANTKTFEGTPTRVGDYTVDVSARPTGVTNNTLTKTVTFRITALPATIHISNNNQTVQVGTAITPSVVTPNQYAEVRGIDSLLSVIGGSDSIGVPEYLIAEYLQSQYGLTYDTNTHTISGKPTKSGKILFRFKSWNTYDLGGESAEETYVLNVTDEQSRIPVITSAIEGEKTISGKGVNEALVTVTLPDGSEKTATVTDGVWTVSTEQALVKGQNISARQKEVNKSVSDNISGSVMAAEAPSVSTLAKVNPIIEGSTSVSGTGVDGSTVTIILPDGTKRTAQVTNGTWTVENIPALSKGQSIVVTQAENGKSSSDAIAITVVPQNTKGDNGLGTIIETETTTDPAGSGRDGLLVKIYSINEQGVKSATPTSTAFIPHGQDGLNGTNGVDGKSVTAIAQPDGSVKIVENDPTTGANRDVAVITNGRDGRDGANGVGTVVVTSAGSKDGKTGVYVRTYTVDTAGVQSETPSSETFVANGDDGSTPTVTVTPGVQNDVNGQFITINDGRGSTTTAFVANGQDGKSVTAVTQPDGSVKIYDTNTATGETKEIATITNGVDGKSVTAIAQPDGSVKIVETDPTTGTNRDVAVITNGRDGRDGKSVTAVVQPDGNVKIVETDPTTGTNKDIAIITNGRDGQNGTSIFVKSVSKDAAGNTIIVLTDGIRDTEIVLSKGDKGDTGQDGKSVNMSENPTLNLMYEGDTKVSGRGISGSTIIVTFKDGSSVTTTVTDEGTWSVKIPYALVRGENVFVTQTEVGKEKSSSVDGTAIWKEANINDSGNNGSGNNGSGSNGSGSNDSGNNGSGSNDSGSNDSGSNDSGSNDSGNNDSGNNSSGSNDSGNNDSGSNDSGNNGSGNNGSNISKTTRNSLPVTGSQESLFLPILSWATLLAAGSIVRKRVE